MNLIKGLIVGLGLTVMISSLLVLPYAWPEIRAGWQANKTRRRV